MLPWSRYICAGAGKDSTVDLAFPALKMDTPESAELVHVSNGMRYTIHFTPGRSGRSLLRAPAAVASFLAVFYSLHSFCPSTLHFTRTWFDRSSAQPQGCVHQPLHRNCAPVALRLALSLPTRLNRAAISATTEGS